jgi:hypothetical protein
MLIKRFDDMDRADQDLARAGDRKGGRVALTCERQLRRVFLFQLSNP